MASPIESSSKFCCNTAFSGILATRYQWVNPHNNFMFRFNVFEDGHTDHEVFDVELCRAVEMDPNSPEFFRYGPVRSQCVFKPASSFGLSASGVISGVFQIHGVCTMYQLRGGGYILVRAAGGYHITDFVAHLSVESFCASHDNSIQPSDLIYRPAV
jgi:hypothetical protein